MIHYYMFKRRLFKSQPRLIVAIDLRMAFNSILHKTIVEAETKREISGRLLNIIKTFLEDRTYKVAIGNTRSRWKHNIGVPQGTVISPALFNLAMTDLALAFEAVPEVRFKIYAGDVTQWTTVGMAESQLRYMKLALDITTAFANESGLEISKDKTFYTMLYNKRKNPLQIKLRADGTPIEETSTLKTLGIPFNKCRRVATWVKHVRKQ